MDKELTITNHGGEENNMSKKPARVIKCEEFKREILRLQARIASRSQRIAELEDEMRGKNKIIEDYLSDQEWAKKAKVAIEAFRADDKIEKLEDQVQRLFETIEFYTARLK